MNTDFHTGKNRLVRMDAAEYMKITSESTCASLLSICSNQMSEVYQSVRRLQFMVSFTFSETQIYTVVV